MMCDTRSPRRSNLGAGGVCEDRRPDGWTGRLRQVFTTRLIRLAGGIVRSTLSPVAYISVEGSAPAGNDAASSSSLVAFGLAHRAGISGSGGARKEGIVREHRH